MQDAITTAGMVWHGMEIFTGKHTARLSKNVCVLAKEADILVGIIAWRYGWQPDGTRKIDYRDGIRCCRGAVDVSARSCDLQLNPEKDFDPGSGSLEEARKAGCLHAIDFQQDQLPAYVSMSTTLGQKVLKAFAQ